MERCVIQKGHPCADKGTDESDWATEPRRLEEAMSTLGTRAGSKVLPVL